eukprot:TRINITY_DN7955_c0_g1_i3.p1 TRINITY_DN7955_c0_g1~~TRINITY_DN7955_c0_g1_i3.p1  ORF type:complete len:252 (+),score=12.98 TRINITY_DN7955_c0_g1_i3:70-825(+)
MFFQPLWDCFLRYDTLVSSPLFGICVPVGWYVLLCLMYSIMDFLPSLHKYKIQADKPVSFPLWWKAFKLNLWTHFAFILPVSVLQVVYGPPIPLPAEAPTVFQVFRDLVILMVVFDFLYFVFHWVFHKWRYGYKTVHSIHHEYHTTFALVTQYVHPVELLATALMSALPPLALNVHPLVNWSWLLISIFISVDAHSGFDFPFGLQHYLPFYGGPITHDMHHQKPNTNYEPFFTYLDLLFGTAAPPQEYKRK